MEPIKIEHVTLNEAATIVKKDGTTVNAKDLFCQYYTYLLDGLAAVQALIKNPIVKLIITILINTITTLGQSLCNK